MFGSSAKKKLAAAQRVMEKSQMGIYKRIDENREFLEMLQERAPGFLKEHFWVEGWIKSQDIFLNDLLAAIPVQNNFDGDRLAYPRIWPKKPADETLAPNPVRLTDYSEAVHFRMNLKLFASILQAVETEALHCGWKFVKGEEHEEIPASVKHRLGTAAIRAKMIHVSPFMAPEEMEAQVLRWGADGDGISWVDGILGALNAQGIAIASAQGDFK